MDLVLWAAHYPTEPGSWAETFKDVTVGVLAGHLRCIQMLYFCGTYQILRPALKKYELIDEVYPKVENGTIKVAMVGYGRTGTHSLYLGLEMVGYRTVHTEQWGDQPGVLDYFHEEFVLPSIQQEKILLGNPDFQKIADMGFTAMGDLPVALFYEQIYEQFPDCKFILTSRDTKSWFESWTSMTKIVSPPLHSTALWAPLPMLTRGSNYLRWLFAYLNQDPSILTMGFPITSDTNPDIAIPLYEAHNERVRQIIPNEQLLEYHPRQGWEPLCKFLELDPCPEGRFPRSNSRLSMQIQAWSAVMLITECVLAAIFGMYMMKKMGSKKKLKKAKTL